MIAGSIASLLWGASRYYYGHEEAGQPVSSAPLMPVTSATTGNDRPDLPIYSPRILPASDMLQATSEGVAAAAGWNEDLQELKKILVDTKGRVICSPETTK
jgi:hypothetical protein